MEGLESIKLVHAGRRSPRSLLLFPLFFSSGERKREAKSSQLYFTIRAFRKRRKREVKNRAPQRGSNCSGKLQCSKACKDSHEAPLVQEEAKLDAFGLEIDANRGDTKEEKSKMRLDKTTQTQVEVGNHPTDRQAENDEDEDWQYEKFLQDKFSSGGEVDTKTKINIGNPPIENDENEDWQYEKFLRDKSSQNVGGEVVKSTNILIGNAETG